MRAVVVPMIKRALVVEFDNFEAIKAHLGIGEGDEWEVLEVNNDSIGIIARDQDEDLPVNRMGIKGEFVVVKMKVDSTEGNKQFTFGSLDEADARGLKVQMAMEALRHAMREDL